MFGKFMGLFTRPQVVAVVTTTVPKTTAEKIAAARKQGPAKKPEGLTVTEAAEPAQEGQGEVNKALQGATLAMQTKRANRRQVLLQTQLSSKLPANEDGYIEMMRRFNQLQNTAGCLDICLHNSNPNNGRLKFQFIAMNSMNDTRIGTAEQKAFEGQKLLFARNLAGAYKIETVLFNLKNNLEGLKKSISNPGLTEKANSIIDQINSLQSQTFSAEKINPYCSFATSCLQEARRGDPVDEAFQSFPQRGHSGFIHSIEISANHSACATIEGQDLTKKLLGEILKNSHGLVAHANHLAGTATNENGNNSIKAAAKVENSVLAILKISDKLLMKEFEALTFVK